MSMMQRILRLMSEKKASDVYLSPGSPALIKINGQCLPVNPQPLARDAVPRLLAEVLPPERVEELEETGELNMAIPMEGVGNFRISGMRQKGLYSAVIRFISPNVPTIESLNVPPILADLVMEKRGLILVVGATGAGKSTTLASMLDHRNARQSGHILTIEDPVEFLLTHKKSIINQREVGSDTQGFGKALRHILRQDPDVVLIGEMRDLETIEAALTISETGHLCLATLHTTSAIGSINRIIDVFPTHQQSQVRAVLSFVLEGVVSQTLIPRASGSGQVLTAEVMIPTPAIRNLIREDKLHQIYSQMQIGQSKHGMVTMNQSLCDLFVRRLITLDDAISRSSDVDELKTLISSAATPGSGPGGSQPGTRRNREE